MVENIAELIRANITSHPVICKLGEYEVVTELSDFIEFNDHGDLLKTYISVMFVSYSKSGQRGTMRYAISVHSGGDCCFECFALFVVWLQRQSGSRFTVETIVMSEQFKPVKEMVATVTVPISCLNTEDFECPED